MTPRKAARNSPRLADRMAARSPRVRPVCEEAPSRCIGKRVELAIAVEARRRRGAQIDRRRGVGVAGMVDRVAQI